MLGRGTPGLTDSVQIRPDPTDAACVFTWSIKSRQQTLGFVAEICQVCEDVTAHELIELRNALFVYWFIRIGRGWRVGNLVQCRECGTLYRADRERYASVSKTLPDSLDKLASLTQPRVFGELHAQQTLESRRKRGMITRDDRLWLMRLALVPIAESFEKRSEEVVTHLDRRAGALWVAALVLPWFPIAGGLLMDSAAGTALAQLGAALLLLGIAAAVQSTWSEPRRYVRKCLADPLVRAVAPFAPSREELAQVLERLQAYGYGLPRRIDADWLHDRVRSQARERELRSGRRAPGG